jgi:hypothetical protein
MGYVGGAETEEAEPIISFQDAEAKTVSKVLDRIDQVAAKRVNEGFSQRNFTLGVFNCFFIAFSLGCYPQHFWFLFLCELTVIWPIIIYHRINAKPLNTVLYFLDYCWMMNAVAVVALVTLLIDRLIVTYPIMSHEFRVYTFLAAYGTSCGPLFGAAGLLPFVSVVFHDLDLMLGLFIHVLPLMITYTFMWYSDEIREAWPGLFEFDYFNDIKFLPDDQFFILPGTHLDTVAGSTLALYYMWFIPYLSWQVLIGLDLPRKNRVDKDGKPIVPKYDTVFHSTVRNGLTVVVGKALWGRPVSVSKKQMENDDYELRDFLVYMAGHATMIYLSVYLLAYPCFLNKTVHMLFFVLLSFICVRRGAERYTYYVTEMYAKAVHKDFAYLLASDTVNKK